MHVLALQENAPQRIVNTYDLLAIAKVSHRKHPKRNRETNPKGLPMEPHILSYGDRKCDRNST
jgi:hypothetical protein